MVLHSSAGPAGYPQRSAFGASGADWCANVAGMYEIRAHIDTTDLGPAGEHVDPDGLEVVLGVHHELAGAHEDADWIIEETWDQLAANGEGHRGFWLHLAIHDTITGQVVAYAGTGLGTP